MDIEKYRRAGVIAQSGLLHALRLLHQNFGETTIGEVCRSTDDYMAHLVDLSFTKSVTEKGIALPCEISKADFVSGVAPDEADVFQGGIVNDGDVIKVAVGVHIDGYTVQAAHTVIAREGTPSEPVTGASADACVAAYLAIEAVLAALALPLSDNHPLAESGPISGSRLRAIVEDIAQAFDCVVVPGSQIRRVQQFVAGQRTVIETNSQAVEWLVETPIKGYTASDNWAAEIGEAYLVDIVLASKGGDQGQIKLTEFHGFGNLPEKPSVYARDYTVSYALKTPSSRALLAQVDKRSVYPFRLGYLASALDPRSIKLGLNEAVQRHLLIPYPRLKAQFVPESQRKGRPVDVAREMTTVLLIPGAESASGFPEELRLGGGRQLAPSWVHSEFTLGDGDAKQLLAAREAKLGGVRYLEVTGRADVKEGEQAAAEMEIE